MFEVQILKRLSFIRLFTIICVILGAGLLSEAKASHFSGGNFEWTCVGQDSFLIRLNLFRDCSGINAPQNVSVTFSGPGCGSFTQQLQQVTQLSGVDTSQVCTPQQFQTTCWNGTLPGMQIYVYEAIVAFPQPCSTWNMAFNQCCRNTGEIGNISGGGFEIQADLNIETPTAINPSITAQHPTCKNNCDGTATASVSGGIDPYTFEWPSGKTETMVQLVGGTATSTDTGLCKGTHIVTITDANECSVETFVTMDPPDPIILTPYASSASCSPSSCDAEAVISVSGGVPPYSYFWSDNTTDSLNTDLCDGSYSVTVVDDAGCQDSSTININTQPVVGSSISINQNPTCEDNCDGEIEANPSGGQAPYRYKWGNGANTKVLTNVCPGTYTVTVLDAQGCESADSIKVDGDTLDINSTIKESACNLCNGEINVTGVINGTPPYTYQWQDAPEAGNSPVADSLCAGSYSLLIIDDDGCSREFSFAINSVRGPSGSTISSFQNESCEGTCDGEMTVTPQGGTPPYTYKWNTGNPNDTDSTVTGLCSGTYSVEVIDSLGCIEVVTETIDTPLNSLILNPAVTPESDCDSCDAQIDVLAGISGTPPYSFNWDITPDPGNTGQVDSLCVGSYGVTVTDDNGCTVEHIVDVNSDSAGMSASFSRNNEYCANYCDGSLTVTPAGGTPPYSIEWQTGVASDTNPTLGNLCAGIYKVIITDSTGCKFAAHDTVFSEIDALEVAPVVSDASCQTCDGEIDLSNVVSGTPPYNYNWKITPDPGDTSILTGLCAGVFEVDITDNNGCTITEIFEIDYINESGADQSSISVTNESCLSSCDGEITANAVGGVAPYHYRWSADTTVNNATLQNACPGIHSVEITDDNGCKFTITDTIEFGINLTTQISNDDIYCDGVCDGSATLSVSGTDQPYSIQWSTGDTTYQIDSLCAGNYSVTVSDSAGCVSEDTVTIADTAILDINIDSVANRVCDNSCDGYASVVVSGGFEPITVIWSDGDTGLVNNSICRDTLAVTAIDGRGCTVTDSLYMTSPAPIEVSNVSITDTDCGGGNGSITVGNVSGGTSPYTYRWNNLPPGGNNSFSNLEPGVNRLVVFDSAGCSDTTFHEVGNTGAPNFGGHCPGNSSPVFGARPIPYVCAGQPVNFNPSVTEPDGDSLVFSLVDPIGTTLNSSNPQQPFGTNVPVTFDSTSGQVQFTPNSGMVTSGPGHVIVIQVCEYRNGALLGCVQRDYQFVIQNCNNVVPWMESAGITNFQGTAVSVDSNEITACVGDHLNFDVIFVDSLPPGASQGDQITITSNASSVMPGANITTTSGDTAIFNLDWTVSQGASNRRNFSIDIEDDACPIPGVGSYNFTIRTIPSTFVPDDTLCGFYDTAYLEPVGGDTFTWRVLSGDSIRINENFGDTTGTDGSSVWASPDSTTVYEVTSNLESSCKNVDTVTVYVRQINAGKDTILCRGDTLTFQPTDLDTCPGATPQYFWSPTTGLDNPSARNPTLTVGPQQTSTMYTLVYDDGCACQTADSFMVEVSDIEIDSVVWDKPVCGDSNATLEIFGSGGFGDYAYSLDSLGTYDSASLFDSLSIGYYEGFVQDSLGCISPGVKDTIIDEGAPDVVLDSFYLQDITCFEAQNGIIDVHASGGAPPLSYSIDSGATFQQGNSEFTGLDPGTFNVIVTDTLDCEALPVQVTLETNAALFLDSIKSRDLDCYEDYTGEIEAFGHGGTDPLEYSIDNGNTWELFSSFDSLGAGNYVVIIRDSFQCTTDPEPVVLTEPNELVADLDLKHDTCFEACGGRATANVSGGTPPYTFNWNGYGANNNQSWNLCSGPSYLFDVTDNNDCKVEIPYSINQPEELVIDSLVLQDVQCNGNKDGQIGIFVSGGKRPYLFSIDDGQTYQSSNSFTSLEAGRYQIVVRDSAQRCEVRDEVRLIEPDPVTIQVPFNKRKICVSNCINISASASGGTGNDYRYTWTGIDDEGPIQTVCPGEDTAYAVYAEDENGCPSNVELYEITLYDSLSVSTENEMEICPGETVYLTAVGQGGDGVGYRYEWTPLVDLSAGVGQSVDASPKETTTYTVEMSDACGSPSVTDTVRVVVHPIPELDFTVEDSTEGCEPYSTVLTNLTEPIQFARWNIGESFTTSGFSIDLQDLSVGTYDVTLKVTSVDGCEDELTREKYITVHPHPQANFYMDPNPTSIFNTMIQFRNNSTPDVTEWEWNFAGQDSAFESNPVYQMEADTGTFPIHLKVRNQFGCADEIVKNLEIGSEYNMYVPNSFTPNSDGLNDVFAPVGLGVDLATYRLEIFNRWGQKIFESNSLSEPWDGRIDGTNEEAPAGVYIWKITVQDNTTDENRHEDMGSVTLIR